MDELKLLIDAVAGLPTLTLWILIGYLIYKLAVIGSIYGVIRYGIEKFVQWKTTPKNELINKTIQVQGISITHDGTFDALMGQLGRITGKNINIDTKYIHRQSVQWLCDAITEKELRESEEKAKKEMNKHD